MRSAAQARAILRSQWAALFGSNKALPWPAERLLLALARHEGQWGAFGGYNVWGIYGGENWGAVQAGMGPPCPDGTFEAGDSKPTADGQKPFRWCFLAYPTPEAGAHDFLRQALVLRPSAMAPLLAGDTWEYARRLRETNYYGGISTTTGEGPGKDAQRRWEQIASYVDALDAHGHIVDQGLGMPPRPPTKKPPPPGGATPAIEPIFTRPVAWAATAVAVVLPVIAAQIWPRRDMIRRR